MHDAPQIAVEERPTQQDLTGELVGHFRQNRANLREEWARRITAGRLLGGMNEGEVLAEATFVYDDYVDALGSGTVEALKTFSRSLWERIIPRVVETHEVIGIVLLLRDLLARSLFAKYQFDFANLNRIMDAYEPAVNRIANTVAAEIAEEGERVIREQQEANRLLSAPVLQILERLLIVTIIGVVDRPRARQLTEQLLRSIRTNRAKVVVIDFTGVSAMDPAGAKRLVHTVEATRLLGASAIITGLSPEITQTFVVIGANLGKMITVGGLQAGLEKAQRLLGRRADPPGEGAHI